MNQIKTFKKEVIEGGDLLKGKITKLKDGTDIKEGQKYQRMIPSYGPANHVKNMKRLVGKYGKQGIGVYLDAVQKFVDKQKPKQ